MSHRDRPRRPPQAAFVSFPEGQEPNPGPAFVNRVLLIGGQLKYCDGEQWINTAGAEGLGLTTKGDLITHDGTEAVRLGVGPAGSMLSADPAEPTGLKWLVSGWIVSGGDAPADAEYLVAAANTVLTAERLVTDTPTVEWDFATLGQAKAEVPAGTFDTFGAATAAVVAHEAASDPHTQYQRESEKDAAGGYAGLDGAGNVGAGRVATASLEDDAVTDAKLRDSAGVSVVGRSANSSGDPADIVAGADDDVLRRVAGLLGFGAIAQASVTGLVAALNAKFKTVAMQVFSAIPAPPASYTPTAGMKFCLVIGTGAGGGGGGADTASGASGQVGVGGGGGAGATCVELYDAATIGASQPISVSFGGAGGSGTGGTAGTDGPDTTFGAAGALFIAGGGKGGAGSGVAAVTFCAAAGGGAGIPVGGAINANGQPGEPGIGFSVNGTTDICFGMSGRGGAGFWGSGSLGRVLAQTSLTADQSQAGEGSFARYGGGGSGGIVLTTAAGVAGGVGGAGIIVVIEFIGD